MKDLPGALVVLQELIAEAPNIPVYVPKRYYARRHHPAGDRAPADGAQLRRQVAAAVSDLADAGYFDDAFVSS